MSINWGQSLINWRPSENAVEVTDQQTKDLLIKFLRLVVEYEIEPEIGLAHFPDTHYGITGAGFSNITLLEEAAKQLEEHQKLWKTHIDQTLNGAYEFPMSIKTVDVLYYFKIIIYIKGSLNESEFKKIQKIKLSFHLNKHGTKKVSI